MSAPQGLYYSKEHTWAKVEADGTVKVGITLHATERLKDIVLIRVEPVGARVRQMEPLGIVESVKAVSEIISPVSGVVEEVNEDVINQPWLINYDPYGDGWIVRIKPTNLEKELKKLLRAEEYLNLVEEGTS